MTRKSSKTLKSEEYRLKRQRNNISVKKSREKSRQKAIMVSQKVETLKNENANLEQTINKLSKEIVIIRRLLLSGVKSENENYDAENVFKSDHEYSTK